MKRNLLLCIALLAASVAFGGPIDLRQAEQTARQFVSSRGVPGTSPLKIVSAGPTLAPATTDDGDAPYYIFNIGDADGFVIVSGDDAAIPVLGYSTRGHFDSEHLPDNFRQWLMLNARYVEQCRQRTGSVTMPLRAGTPVQAPLLGNIQWGQDDPYNLQCPTYTSSGVIKHYYVGCVATAATQIMRYYAYPPQGNDSKTYTDTQGCGQTLSADFGSTAYAWDKMLSDYRAVEDATATQKDAVSTLAYHFGVAVDMEYKVGGSGAVSPIVPHAFRHFFRYDGGTVMRKRNYYETSEWMHIIKSEIDAQRPVYYAASSEDGLGGHAFVCDGYDSEDFVHINWGWYGNYNGYFSVNHLEPEGLGEGGGKGQYNIDQEIITGIRPPSSEPSAYERPLYFSTMMTCNDFGTQFSIGGTIENFDVTPFTGQIAAVLERDGEMLAVLKEETKNIAAYANRRTGYIMGFVLRDIEKSVSATIANGDAYVRLMYREHDADEWKPMRHAIGRNPQNIPYSDRVKVRVSNGNIVINGVDTPVPNVTVTEKLQSAFAEIHAKGSLLLPVTLRNDSRHLTLQNIIVRFQSEADNGKVYDYENPVNIYNGSTEQLRFLINLRDTMPAGNYRLILFEKGFESHPFVEEYASDVFTVLPEATHPVMHLTQNVAWQRRDGQLIANQGDAIYFALNARNYGAAGKVGVILSLVDVGDATKRYVFQQSDAQVSQGEAKTLTFYRPLPVDPGIYRIQVSYATADGIIADDPMSLHYDERITVGTGDNIRLNGVAVDMPDEVVKGTRLTGSVTFEAPSAFSGTLYVRMRQYTLTNGGILAMGNATIAVGQQHTVNISTDVNYDIGRYILVYDFGASSTASVGNYSKVYKLIDVVNSTTGVGHLHEEAQKAVVFLDGHTLCVATKNGVSVHAIDVFDVSGQLLNSVRQSHDLDVSAFHGVLVVRVTTSEGISTQKVMKP